MIVNLSNQNSQSTVITTTLRSNSIMAKKFSSHARARLTRHQELTESFLDRWVQSRSSLKEKVWQKASTLVHTARAASFLAVLQSARSRVKIWNVRQAVLNVART